MSDDLRERLDGFNQLLAEQDDVCDGECNLPPHVGEWCWFCVAEKEYNEIARQALDERDAALALLKRALPVVYDRRNRYHTHDDRRRMPWNELARDIERELERNR